MKFKSTVLIAFVVTFFGSAAVFALCATGGYFGYMKNMPEQVEHVEVTGKRIREERDREVPETYYHYYVTFKFPDGSEKEFEAGRPNVSVYYNSIYEGDTGMLAYKEKGNSKRFESFEKDPDYGGLKIEPHKRGDMMDMAWVIIVLIVSYPFFVWVVNRILKNYTRE